MSEEPSPFCTHRGGDRGDQGRSHGRGRGFSRPRERGRPVHGGRVRQRRCDQLHGHARPRADLPDPDARALRGARAADDGAAQPDALRDGVHGLDRGPRGHRDRHLGQGSRAHDRGRLRDGHGPARHHQAGARVPAARPPGRRARAHRPDRGLGRSRAARRRAPGGRHLRGHEGRRHDGPRARSRRRSAPSTGSSSAPSPT